MIVSIIILIVGFIVLIKGADLFVDAASSLALNFKLSKMLIALTIVAFGTSAPELAVSIKSILSGSGSIVLGNVIGSNILNILLILGVSSCIHTLAVKNATVKKELPITILLTTLFSVLICDKLFNGGTNALTRSDGITIMLFFMVFVYYIISNMRNKVDEDEEEKPKYSILVSIGLTIVGIICLVLGSNAVVDSAVVIAGKLGVTERIIALTIIALGTSLPELVTSIVAARKREVDIAIGNVVGSNIFNIGIVLGLPITLFGGIEKIAFGYLDMITMLVATVLLFIFCYNDRKLTRKEGLILLTIFILYYGYILIK